MSSQAAHSVRVAFAPLNWLWTWNGDCFGYRRDHSLFTYDGVEVGRFSGKEIYGPDGRYLGEVVSTEEGDDRLITSNYKKARSIATAFVPTIERAQPRAANCFGAPLYCGYEDFPSPKVLKDLVLERNAYQRNRIQ
jgi:hypothetical protein